MRNKLALAVVFAVCFVVALFSVSWAGVEPAPWKPEMNRLNAVENNLQSVLDRVNRVLSIPPDPFTPSPATAGAVGRLSAMENQLLLLRGMVVSVVDEVLGTPPDPYVPADLLPALEGVRASSQGIADSINAYLGNPPDPWIPAEFISAVTSLGLAAQNLADDAVNYMRGGACTPGITCGCVGIALPCPGFTSPTSCNSQIGCAWSTAAEVPCIGTPTACSGFDLTTCVNQAGCKLGTCMDGTCQ